MDKILNAFQNLFEGSKKTHFLAAMLFYLPCLAATTIQMIDKDTSKATAVPLLILACVLFVFSIIPMLMLQGFWYKFLNRRFNEPYGLPDLGWDCLLQGIKGLPIGIVWSLYVSVPCFILMGGLIALLVVGIMTFKENMPVMILTILLFCLLLFLLFVGLFIISPFLAMVYMKYSENFEYKKELFNPLLIFKFMKVEFKEVMFTALKFIVVNFVTNIAAQLIVVAGVIVGMIIVFGGMLVVSSPDKLFEAWGFIIPAIIYMSVFTTISAYIHWITQLAYADNLEEIYVEKMLDVK